MIEAFQAVKQALTQAAVLSHPHMEAPTSLTQVVMPSLPHMEAPTSLTVDASDLAVGGVLQQWINDQWEPPAFSSKKLKPAESITAHLIGNSWGCI